MNSETALHYFVIFFAGGMTAFWGGLVAIEFIVPLILQSHQYLWAAISLLALAAGVSGVCVLVILPTVREVRSVTSQAKGGSSIDTPPVQKGVLK